MIVQLYPAPHCVSGLWAFQNNTPDLGKKKLYSTLQFSLQSSMGVGQGWDVRSSNVKWVHPAFHRLHNHKFKLFYSTPFRLFKFSINSTSLRGTQRMWYFIYYVLCNSSKCQQDENPHWSADDIKTHVCLFTLRAGQAMSDWLLTLAYRESNAYVDKLFLIHS